MGFTPRPLLAHPLRRVRRTFPAHAPVTPFDTARQLAYRPASAQPTRRQHARVASGWHGGDGFGAAGGASRFQPYCVDATRAVR